MGECCAGGPADPKAEAAEAPANCPACGAKGKKVKRLTVLALLRPSARARVRDDAHRICLSPSCDTVYFGRTDRFGRDEVNVRVGQKETAPDRLVCYCFHHTPASIEDEIRRTGRSTVVERIKAEVQAGRCACEATNPEGTCCLGNVGRAVKEATEAVRSGRTREPGR